MNGDDDLHMAVERWFALKLAGWILLGLAALVALVALVAG